MASFDHVNFNLRPNKNVERKLFVELLHYLAESFPIDSYRYIGMGSMWFVDFKLMHKQLGISNLLSMEKAAVDRARFNRPFDCVRVIEGEASMILRKDVDLTDGRSIIWLDYDTTLGGPALEDLMYVSGRLPSGSILAVTINAHHGQLRDQKDPEGNELDRKEALEDLAGSFVPSPLPEDGLNRQGFPHTACSVLLNAIRHSVRKSGRDIEARRLFAFSYSDNAPMVTVAAMVANDEDLAKLRELQLGDDREYVGVDWDAPPFRIDVPPLTTREKGAIDQHLPQDDRLTQEYMNEALDFSLKQSQLDAYQRFYRHYPVYGELVI